MTQTSTITTAPTTPTATTTGRPKGQSNISVEDFIRTYQTSNSHKEVAQRLNRSVVSVYSRAKKYKKKGIKLKTMPRKQTIAIDVEAANEYIQTLK